MTNPWILLGLLVFWLASVGSAYWKGAQNAENRARSDFATQLEATIAQSRENAVIDMAAARDAGEREAKARVKTVTITNQVERVIREKPAAAECRLSPDTFGLLVAATAVANGTDPDAAKPVPNGSAAASPSR